MMNPDIEDDRLKVVRASVLIWDKLVMGHRLSNRTFLHFVPDFPQLSQDLKHSLFRHFPVVKNFFLDG